MEDEIQVPVLHAIQDTCRYLKERGITAAGIMATDGTVQSKLFQTEMEAQGIRPVVPGKEGQAKVMDLIYNQVKKGKTGDLSMLEEVALELKNQGAQVYLLGCTELSLLKRDYPLPAGYLDVMEVLARQAVLECGQFRREYEELITK